MGGMVSPAELREVAHDVETRGPGRSDTHERAVELYVELKRLGFPSKDSEFASVDRAGFPAWDAATIAHYFRSCADELEKRQSRSK
jgi:hypothetical protein